jgi:hypothetical protein
MHRPTTKSSASTAAPSSSTTTTSSASASASASANRGVRFVSEPAGNDNHTNNHNNFNYNQPSTGNTLLSSIWWDTIVDIITGLIALWCTFGLFIILAILYVTIRPFSKSTYRRLACIWGNAALIDTISLLLPNCRIYLTGDSDIPSPVGSSVLVANHVVPVDWWAICLLGRCVGLRGNLKVFLRNEFLQVNIANVDVDGSLRSSAGAAAAAAATGAGATSTTTTSTVVTNGQHTGTNGTIIPQQQTTSSSPIYNTSNTNINSSCRKAAPDVSLMAKLLHLFLEFPLINGDEYTSDREQLFTLLRSFASPPETASPVHLLLYPECWSMHNGTDRKLVHAKSNGFAKREGKPTLKHLLLPRTRGFNASLECLREASPVVYDVTMVRFLYMTVNKLDHSIYCSIILIILKRTVSVCLFFVLCRHMLVMTVHCHRLLTYQ